MYSLIESNPIPRNLGDGLTDRISFLLEKLEALPERTVGVINPAVYNSQSWRTFIDYISNRASFEELESMITNRKVFSLLVADVINRESDKSFIASDNNDRTPNYTLFKNEVWGEYREDTTFERNDKGEELDFD